MTAFLTAQGVSVKLAGRLVLRDVSLALSPGHLVALVGPNGAGKTTLLRALAGLVPATGAIHVGGDALSSLSLPSRALAAAGTGYRRTRPLPAWCDRPSAIDAARCRGGAAGDARD
jgi:iron complex transport system ATP-binding protein